MGIRSRVTFGAILALVATAALAQNPKDCAAVQFSDEVLARFPRAPEACLDVISRGGQDYAVFNAQLVEVRGNTMRVRFHLPDGSLGPTQSITPPNDFRVLINGQPTRVSDLQPNQDLKAYVEVTRPVLALEPADTGQRLVIVPLVAEEEVADDDGTQPTRVAEVDPQMPRTAGPAPIFASFGLLLACAALCMRLANRWRASHEFPAKKISSRCET
jgi:hypothetical protein